MNEHHNALRKYLSDVEQAFGRDIRSRSPNASEADINAAIANAVEHKRASSFNHTIIDVETGNAYTNSIGKELLPNYLELVSLVDSIDVLLQSHLNLISLLGVNGDVDIGGGDGGDVGGEVGEGVGGSVEQRALCSTERLGKVLLNTAAFFLVICLPLILEFT